MGAKRQLVRVLDRIYRDYAANTDHGLSTADDLLKISFADYLGELEPEVDAFMKALAKVACMVDAEGISAKYAMRYLVSKLAKDRDHASCIPQGMQEIAHALHQRVAGQVQLSSEIQSVEETPDGEYLLTVRADGQTQEVVVGAVIIAVPGPAVAELVPTLPDWKLAAIEAIPTTSSVTLALVLEDTPEAVWKDLFWTATPGLSFNSIFDGWAATGRSDGRRRIQLAAFGDTALAAMSLSDDEVRSDWLADLELVFPGSSDRLVGTPHVQRWHNCFALPRADRAERLLEVRRPIGRLFFAGDYTSEAAGTHGSIGSGERVAAEIADVLV